MLEVHSPRMLWIRLGGPAAGTGNRHDNQRALHLSQIALRQIDKGGLVVLEANARSMVWSLDSCKSLLNDCMCMIMLGAGMSAVWMCEHKHVTL